MTSIYSYEEEEPEQLEGTDDILTDHRHHYTHHRHTVQNVFTNTRICLCHHLAACVNVGWK